jgi:hypothetical protein
MAGGPLRPCGRTSFLQKKKCSRSRGCWTWKYRMQGGRVADEADLLLIRRVEDLSPCRKCRSGIFVTSALACRQGLPFESLTCGDE